MRAIDDESVAFAAQSRLTQLPAAIIFDMDGLMLDTESLAAQAWIDAATTLGIAFDTAVTGRLIGRTTVDCEHVIREHHGADYPVGDLMRGWSLAYSAIVVREGIALKTGLLELLQWVDRQHIPRAVATSTRRLRAAEKLANAGLLSGFGALVGGDEVLHGKPAPDIFIEAAARLGIAAGDCVVLEDSEAGVHAAVAAGMNVILVPDLIVPSAALRELNVIVRPSLHEVKTFFEQLVC